MSDLSVKEQRNPLTIAEVLDTRPETAMFVSQLQSYTFPSEPSSDTHLLGKMGEKHNPLCLTNSEEAHPLLLPVGLASS